MISIASPMEVDNKFQWPWHSFVRMISIASPMEVDNKFQWPWHSFKLAQQYFFPLSYRYSLDGFALLFSFIKRHTYSFLCLFT
jgi:hypothetical protein